MNITNLFVLLILLTYSCKNNSNSSSVIEQSKQVTTANEFINAFYSFDSVQLKSVLTHAPESLPSILFYQGWAEGGNYQIIERHDCTSRNDSIVICPVTVKDDLIDALEVDYNVTDTFHITIINDRILSVETSSNDPPLYYEAKEWVLQNDPELIEIPCQGAWEGGTTPGECVKGMVHGFTKFTTFRKSKG